MRGWICSVIILICVLPEPALPCSSFVATNGRSVLVGNNKDLRPSEQQVTLFFVPGKEGKFGKACWGSDRSETQCGFNEAGLFVDFTAVPVISETATRGTTAPAPISCLILDQCATVDEAIAMFRQYCVPRLCSMHWFVADRNGDAAVIEWDGDELRIIPKSGPFQVMTNFRLSDPGKGGHPCYRYNALLKLLRQQQATPDLMRRALEVSHLEELTCYSDIIDLGTGSITIFGHHDFGRSRRFVLSEELAHPAHSYSLEELFPLRRVSMDRLERRNGLIFEIGAQHPFSGICFLRHENGQLLKEGTVKNGLCSGSWKYYDEAGNTTREDQYKRVLLYFDSGVLQAEGMLKNGLMMGPWTWYNENGEIALDGEAIDGIFYTGGDPSPYNGSLKVYFRNGDRCLQRGFDRGLLDGDAMDWYENGHLRLEGRYEEGRQDGQWRYYKRDGSLDRIMLFEDYPSGPQNEFL